MPKILGIEIGSSRIRICEEDYNTKNPKVYRSVSIKTPAGVVNDGELDVREELVSAIKDALVKNKIRTKKIIFSMNSTKIASREIVIPFVKENKIKNLIAANVTDYFPVDLEQYEIGHSVIGVINGENDTKQYKVLVLAVPLTIIESYFALASSLGCDVVALDYSGNSIYQIVRRHCDAGVQMVIKVDENSTMVTVLRNQEVALQRTVPYGVEEAVAAEMDMMEYNDFDYDNAVRAFKEENRMEDVFVAQALEDLVNGISRVVDYFTRNNNTPIEKVYLSGLGGSFRGLADVISRATDLTVEPLTEIKNLHFERYFKDESFGEYLTCLGAAIAPIGFMGLKEKEKISMTVLPDEKSMLSACILFMVACLVGAAALLTVSYMGLWSARADNTELKDRIEELQDAENVYRDYLQQRYTYGKLMYFQSSTVTYNEKLVAFIEEMELKMPSSLNVQSFSAGLTGVTMSVTVSDKREAAKMIQQFRSFDTVEEVEVTSLYDSGAVMDGEVLEEEPVVNFSISVTYKDNVAASVPQAPDPSSGTGVGNVEENETVDEDDEIVGE